MSKVKRLGFGLHEVWKYTLPTDMVLGILGQSARLVGGSRFHSGTRFPLPGPGLC